MRYINISELILEKKKLLEFRNEYEEALKDLSEYKDYYLKKRIIRGRERYYMCQRGSRKERYIGAGDKGTVVKIKRCVFYTEAIKEIDNNIEAIDQFVNQYDEFFPKKVVSKLNDCYHNVSNIGESKWTKGAEEWLAEMNASKSKHEPYRPEDLVHVAIDGTKVRTKAELQIYNLLVLLGVPFVYEPVIETKYGRVVPDFAIYNERTGEVFFLEHMGMFYNQDYYNRQFAKFKKYASINYTPGNNLIITVDDVKGNFDTTMVAKKLKVYLDLDIDLNDIA